MSDRKWSSKVLNIKVTNMICGREDVHRYISPDEVEWIRLNPNLKVQVLEVLPRRSQEGNNE
jgi:hypothetical protein